MKNIKFLSIMLLSFALGLTSCTDDGVDDILESPANARVFFGQFSPSLGLADNLNTDFFFGNNTTQNPRLGFAAFASRTPTPGVPFRVGIQPAAAGELATEVISGMPEIEGRKNYTALVANADASSTQGNAPVGMIFIEDDLTPAPAGSTKVRFIHLAVGAPAVDVYLVPSAGDPVIIRNIAYGQSSGGNLSIPAGGLSDVTPVAFAQIPAGTYRAEVRPAGADPASQPVLAVNNLNLTPRRNTGGAREYWEAFTIVANGYLTQPSGVTSRALRATLISHDDNFADEIR
ncbi:MAG: DUF4397 domain-containing protein [Cyclobacteriaceae bacterium]|nr:DUF4397 domain-containing protein [Cyclobacteriaceae bacterium]